MRVEQSRLDIVTDELGLAVCLPDFISDQVELGKPLLRAIADVESSYGQNSNPRHEPAYCHGGKYYHVVLTKLYGCAAHSSYGPWQVIYPTAYELGFFGAPEELANPETNCLYAVRYLNARAAKATTLEQLARCYNGGNIHAKAVPQSYIDKLTAAYRKREAA
jgi:hypothetical protein